MPLCASVKHPSCKKLMQDDKFGSVDPSPTSASSKIYFKRYYMRLSSRVLIQDDAQSIQLGRRIIYGLVNESII